MVARKKKSLNEILESAASMLDTSDDFRVLRRLKERDEFTPCPSSVRPSKLVIIDTETTGRDHAVDKIIEIGFLVCRYSPVTGEIFDVVATYNALEDPGMSISPEASAVNGITDEMVKGLKIDDDKVYELVHDASLVIAHNSMFDRPFLEERLPIFKKLPWGCSRMQVAWEAEHLPAKLQYLANEFGFFYDAHRAEVDCRALLEVIRSPLPVTEGTAFQQILKARDQETFRVWAVNSPFSSKDALKARGYRWSGGDDGVNPKAWNRSDLNKAELEAELEFLKAEVYRTAPSFKLTLDRVNCFNRYSTSQVTREEILVENAFSDMAAAMPKTR